MKAKSRIAEMTAIRSPLLSLPSRICLSPFSTLNDRNHGTLREMSANSPYIDFRH